MADNNKTQIETGINTAMYMDDVELAKRLLENADQNGGTLSNSDIVFALRNILKMKYYPVAVKYFFEQAELDEFKNNVEYKTAINAVTFCAYVAASRQRGDILLGTEKKMGCGNAKFVLKWKEMDESEIKSHLKYTKNREQAERFIKTKKGCLNLLLPLPRHPCTKPRIHRT